MTPILRRERSVYAERGPMKTLLFVLLSLSVAWADVGPRPRIVPEEVNDSQNYLEMHDETVNVTIQGHRAHVVADFHFVTAQSLRRRIIDLRMGFPELTSDAPLQNLKVLQGIGYVDQLAAMDRVSHLQPQPIGTGLSQGLHARWMTWPVRLVGSSGAPIKLDVRNRVSYDQELTPEGAGKWRYTYVLRSGAPWVGPIGSAHIDVKVQGARVLSASPKTVGLHWSMSKFEPDQDIVVLVKSP
jgi:hypothetical protein